MQTTSQTLTSPSIIFTTRKVMENASKMTQLLKANAPPQLTQMLEPVFWQQSMSYHDSKSYREICCKSFYQKLWRIVWRINQELIVTFIRAINYLEQRVSPSSPQFTIASIWESLTRFAFCNTSSLWACSTWIWNLCTPQTSGCFSSRGICKGLRCGMYWCNALCESTSGWAEGFLYLGSYVLKTRLNVVRVTKNDGNLKCRV